MITPHHIKYIAITVISIASIYLIWANIIFSINFRRKLKTPNMYLNEKEKGEKYWVYFDQFSKKYRILHFIMTTLMAIGIILLSFEPEDIIQVFEAVLNELN